MMEVNLKYQKDKNIIIFFNGEIYNYKELNKISFSQNKYQI